MNPSANLIGWNQFLYPLAYHHQNHNYLRLKNHFSIMPSTPFRSDWSQNLSNPFSIKMPMGLTGSDNTSQRWPEHRIGLVRSDLVMDGYGLVTDQKSGPHTKIRAGPVVSDTGETITTLDQVACVFISVGESKSVIIGGSSVDTCHMIFGSLSDIKTLATSPSVDMVLPVHSKISKISFWYNQRWKSIKNVVSFARYNGNDRYHLTFTIH